jgi:hypothetical protein
MSEIDKKIPILFKILNRDFINTGTIWSSEFEEIRRRIYYDLQSLAEYFTSSKFEDQLKNDNLKIDAKNEFQNRIK